MSCEGGTPCEEEVRLGLLLQHSRAEFEKRLPFSAGDNERCASVIEEILEFGQKMKFRHHTLHLGVTMFRRFLEKQYMPCLLILGFSALFSAASNAGEVFASPTIFLDAIHWPCTRSHFLEVVENVYKTVNIEELGATAAECFRVFLHLALCKGLLQATVENAKNYHVWGTMAVTLCLSRGGADALSSVEIAAGAMEVLTRTTDVVLNMTGLTSWDVIAAVDFMQPFVIKASGMVYYTSPADKGILAVWPDLPLPGSSS